MKLEERIVLFYKFGEAIKTKFGSEEFDEVLFLAKSKNAWFTIDNIQKSIENICTYFLNKDKIEAFVKVYPTHYFTPKQPKKIGIIAAGNLPLVGFQDFIHVVLCGHCAYYKPSSQDDALILYFQSILQKLNPKINDYFKIVEKLNDVDAIIATGSNNSSRYFEYYFAQKPHIIRKNRSSIAILDGSETKIDLANLGDDIFEYFGLGCRNVSKLYVPKDYNFDVFFEAIEYWNTIRMHSKYNNNYDYMKAIYLVNMEKHLDNGFLLLKENNTLNSPISVVYYEYYDKIEDIALKTMKNELQLIVSKNKQIKNAIDFGKSQAPELNDFADEIDTIAFLAQNFS